MEAKDPVAWTQAEVEEYLYHELHVVYSCLNIFIRENRRHPVDAQELIDAGIIAESEWPDNPLNGWQPVGWEHWPCDFKPGELVIQLCPPDWYSRGKVEPVPLTFIITINGTSEDFVTEHPAKMWLEPIFDWDVIPPGTAFVTSAYVGAADGETIAEKLRDS